MPPLGLEVFGLASGLNFKCERGKRQSLCPVTVPSAEPELKFSKMDAGTQLE